MTVGSILILVILIVLIVGLLPHWPYSSTWGTGYFPSGALGIILIILLVLLLTGRL